MHSSLASSASWNADTMAGASAAFLAPKGGEGHHILGMVEE